MARIGVVGAGRVGAVLSAALDAAGHQVVAAAGETDASRIRIETLLPGVPRLKPTAVARACDVLLLAVPDDALSNVVSMLSAAGAIREGQYVVHTSGAHGASVLQPAADRGAHVAAMHPAMTFTGTDVDFEHLPGCIFGCTVLADQDASATSARELVERLVADLDGRAFWIAEEDRVLYHAALAHGANHLVTLVNQAMELLRGAGVEDPSATLRPLLEAALDNSLSYGDAALTGPIVRGDLKTVRAHLATLKAQDLETLDSYIAMARATANHAVLDGRLQPARAAAIIGALNDARVKAAR